MSDIQSQTEAGPGSVLHVSPPTDVSFVRDTMVGSMPAPAGTSGPVGWVRENLLSSPLNILQTLLAVGLLLLIMPGLIGFGLIEAVWTGDDRTVCATEVQGGVRDPDWRGACWAYVGAYLDQFIYGTYPVAERWRVNIAFVLLAIALVPLLVPSLPYKKLGLLFSGVVFPVTSFILLTGGEVELTGFLFPGSIGGGGFANFVIEFAIVTALLVAIAFAAARATGGEALNAARNVGLLLLAVGIVLLVCSIDFGLRFVRTELWGGMLVTLVIAVSGIAASLPLGILLALGRRSSMPLVRLLCVTFIEFWRGVPLVTVLFMSSVMLPLLASEGVSIDKLFRDLIGVALFASAYMAEVIRGGLQAIPKGQYEGADAMGLSYWQSMRLIILPQALTLVIPGIVNTFIGLFKDTTLVLIIGLFDFLGQIRASFSDPTWASPVQARSAFLFAAVVYFVFCFAMSRYSIFMEQRLAKGHKR